MRRFVVLGHEAPTTAEFSLEDLPGAGRLDALCRCVTSAFCLSHAIRENVRVELVLADSYTIRFEGSELRRLNPDERSTAALVRNALENREGAIGAMEANPSPGVYISRRDGETTIREAADQGTVLTLHEDGDPAIDVDPPTDPVFVLSDHREFTDAETELLGAVSDRRLSVGPEVLHADHAIVVAHNWLDTAGFSRY